MALFIVREPATGAPHVRRARAPYILGMAFVIADVAAALSTFAFGRLLSGPPVMNGSARGTALVMAAIAAPTLVVSMRLTSRGSTRALVVWFGMTLHLVYNTVLLVLGEPMNRVFLLYEASLALGVAAAVAIYVTTDLQSLARLASPAVRARAFSVYLWLIVGFNALAWLRRIVPAVIDDTVPALLDGTGLSVVPTYAEDLAFWLPFVALAAWWLWQGRPLGFLLSGGALAFWAVEGLTVAADQWFGHRADPASTVASAAAVVPFVVLAVVGTVVLWRFLRYLAPRGR